MFCPNCGNELREDACFCGNCGTRVGNAIQPTQQHPANQRPLTAEDLKNYHEATRVEREFEKSVERTSEYAVLMKGEYKQLKSRFTMCTILGVIVAVGFGSMVMSTASSPNMVVTMIATCGLFFFVPFGVLPIVDFVKNHGFVVWFSVIFLLILFYFVLLFAIFAGIPCFISLCNKLKKTKAEVDLANEQLSALVA